MLACGNRAIVDGKKLFEFRNAGGLLSTTSLGTACLAVSVLRAARNAAERAMMAVVIVKVGAAWRYACEMAAGVFLRR